MKKRHYTNLSTGFTFFSPILGMSQTTSFRHCPDNDLVLIRVDALCIRYALPKLQINNHFAADNNYDTDAAAADDDDDHYGDESSNSNIHSDFSIAPLQVLYYSEALPTQHGYYAGISC